MNSAAITPKIDMAIQAYIHRKTDLRGGAAMASVSYNRFAREIEERNIIVMEDDGVLERLAFLAEAFENEELSEAIKKVALEPEKLEYDIITAIAA